MIAYRSFEISRRGLLDTARALRDLVEEYGIKKIHFDLDLTLVDSRPLYLALEMETCRHFGFDDPLAISRHHQQVLHCSAREILESLYALASAAAPLSCTSIDEFEEKFVELLNGFSSGEVELDVTLRPMPGARELIAMVRELGVDYVITTHSRRNGALALLERAGLKHIVPADKLVCDDDIPYKKDEEEYWECVSGDVEAEARMGFEDNPRAARWMLEKGNMGLVAVLEGDHAVGYDLLADEFGARVRTCATWHELL